LTKVNLRKIWDNVGTLIILGVFVLVIGILSPKYFLDPRNLIQIALQSSIVILLACGQFFAMLIAGIDLSVETMSGLCGIVIAKMLVSGIPIPICIIAALLIGAILGLINGALINVTSLHPFIITLGTQSVFLGMTLLISNARAVYGLPEGFVNGIAGTLGIIPIPVIIALIVALILAYVTNKTIFGRNIYAIGGNKQAAKYAGINIELHTLVVFMISGIMAGIAGIVTTARLSAADPLAGVGLETTSIAAAVIGGTSFFGGRGKISVVIGGLIIGTISNGLNILNVPTYYQQVAMGLLIILAVALDRIIGTSRR
jgi:D-allose transport system permease protein